jgi:serine/threonine-protein kinase
VTEGPHRGQAFEFREHDTFMVGRSKDAHFRLPFKDKTLSRFHFMVEVNPPSCRLMDMASRNGTLVNGLKVSVIDLKDGDTIEGGRSVLAVSIKRDPAGPDSSAEIDATRPAIPRPAGTGLATTVDVPAPDWSVPGYHVEQVLGEGGMGVVYRARRESDGAIIALAKRACFGSLITPISSNSSGSDTPVAGSSSRWNSWPASTPTRY